MANANNIRAGRAYVEISGDDSQLNKALQLASRRLKSWGASVAKAGAAIGAIGASGVTALGAIAKGFAAQGDAMDKMSARTGASVEYLSALAFAAQQSGTSVEAVETAMRQLARTGEYAGMATEDAFTDAISRIKAIDNPLERAQAAMRLFGRQGTALLPMVDSMGDLMDEARRLGIVMSGPQARAAAALTDAWGRLDSQWKAVRNTIGEALAPALKTIADYMSANGKQVIDWIRDNGRLVVTIGAVSVALVALGGALTAIGGALMGLGSIASLGASLATFLSGPAGLVAAGAAAALASLYAIRDELPRLQESAHRAFESMAADARRAFGGLSDAVALGDWESAMKVVSLSLKVMWEDTWTEMFAWLRKTAITELPKILMAVANPVQTAMKQLFKRGFSGATEEAESVQSDARRELDVLLRRLGEARDRRDAESQGASIDATAPRRQGYIGLAATPQAPAWASLGGGKATGVSGYYVGQLEAASGRHVEKLVKQIVDVVKSIDSKMDGQEVFV